MPALTPLAAADPLCRACQGMTLEAELTLWLDARREVSVTGSFLFAHFGYTGPAALDLSRHWLRAEGRGERRVTASFVPGESAEAVLASWLGAAGEEPRLTVRRHLSQRLPSRLADALCAEAAVEPGAQIAQVAREPRARLIELLTARVLPVSGTLGYEKAEATSGGVELSELDPGTMESRRCPGLYLCGEMLDVDGRLGGFNFQCAWSSGMVAGRSAGRCVG